MHYLKNKSSIIPTLAVVFIALLSLATVAQTSNITLKVTGIENAKGQMSIALYDSADDFPGTEKYVKALFKDVDSTTFAYVFRDIPNGTYAIAIYHDLDSNDEMNKNWIGIPKEPYGFSNNAMGRMGPPDFEDAAFEVNGNIEVIIKLKD